MKTGWQTYRMVGRALLVTIGVMLAGGALPVQSNAVGTAVWKAPFPAVTAYPRGTHLTPVYATTHAELLIGPQAREPMVRLNFVRGGIQYAVLPQAASHATSGQAVASVTILTFRQRVNATIFVRTDHPASLANPKTPAHTVEALGTDARYVSGACAACGPGAPPLGILLLPHGRAAILILTQPANKALAIRLGESTLRQPMTE